MNNPPPIPAAAKPSLAWYQHVWTALPLALLFVGGAVGGACGGIAWAINQKVLKRTTHPALRYVWTGLISLAAFLAYLVIAVVILMAMRQPD